MDKVISFSKKHENILLLLVSAAIISIPIICFKISYNTTDDFVMNFIAAGGWGKHSVNLTFPNVAYGAVLKVLYTIVPFLNWYCVMFMAGLAASLLVMLKIAVARKSILGLFMILLCGIGMPFYLNFTVIAYIMIAAGVAWCCEMVHRKERSWIMYAVSVVLILFGYMIRSSVMCTAIALFLPFIIVLIRDQNMETRQRVYILLGLALMISVIMYLSYKYSAQLSPLKYGLIIIISAAGYFLTFKAKIWREFFTVIFIVLVCIAVLNVINFAVQNSAEWQEAMSYTRARALIYDGSNVKYEEIEDQLNNAGISLRDITMIKNCLFVDKHVFSEENFRKIAELSEGHYEPESIKIDFQTKFIILLPVIITALMFVLQKKNRMELVICAVIIELMFLLLILMQRVVSRVSIPLCIIYILNVVLLIDKNKFDKFDKKKLVKWALLIAIVPLCLGIYRMRATIKHAQNLWSRVTQGSEYEETIDYFKEHPDEIFFLQDYTFLYRDRIAAIDVNKETIDKNTVHLGFWDSYSPRFYDKLTELGIKDTERVMLEFVNNDSVRFAVKDYGKYSVNEHYRNMDKYEIVKEYLEEQTGKEITVKVEKEFENGFVIYDYDYKDQ